MSARFLPFNRPYVAGREFEYMREAAEHAQLAGDGPFTRRCHAWLEGRVGCHRALLTHSCTAALEMTALLANVGPGDEVIMPSFTFVSTANAFVLRGATPIFVDIRPDTLNLDEARIEEAITPRTRAIVAVHYAGVGCEMDAISRVAAASGLLVIEDAAQAFDATYRGRPLGSFGQLAAMSFHETKNIVAGEGGALYINDPAFVIRAEILREKGTDRSQFVRGQVDKYRWMDVGSSFLPGELIAAFLYAQMERADVITRARRAVWQLYDERLQRLEASGVIRRPIVPPDCEHNAHMYYVLVRDLETRSRVLTRLNAAGVNAVFHYVPLHSSPAGIRFGRTSGTMAHTTALSDRLLRLPLWVGMTPDDVDYAVGCLASALA
jgi:dTDP-4-amino-4,6-dideoxygalactose transaminase